MDIENEKKIEVMFNRNQLLPKLTTWVQKNENISSLILANNLDVKVAEQLAIQLIIHKRMDIPTAIGVCRNKTYPEDLQKISNEILRCLVEGLCSWDSNREQLVVKYDIPEEMEEELALFQFPMPMLIEPETIVKNNQNGYRFTQAGGIVLNSSSKKYKKIKLPLEPINKLNKVKLSLNTKIVNLVDKLSTWKSDSEMSQKNLAKFNRNAKSLCNFYIKNGNEFYLTHKFDRRGRIYSVAYLINDQGTTWGKGIIEFANKEKIN